MTNQTKFLIRKSFNVLFIGGFLISFFLDYRISGLILPLLLIFGGLLSTAIRLPLFGTKNLWNSKNLDYKPTDASQNKLISMLGLALIAFNLYLSFPSK